MTDPLNLLWLTVLLRPYVFGYFLLYALSGRRELGAARLALFTGLAFGLAWLSEYGSINTGLPYGWYRYHQAATAGRELWLAGVPFFDSLSYTFLAYASLCAARRRLGPGASLRSCALLGGLLMLLQDVVVDPVAVRGGRWFLGDLFDYPNGGLYFGVPLSNFAGWLLVGVASCAAYLALERALAPLLPAPPAPRHPWLTGAALYFLIMAFNVALAFWIGEPALGAAGLGWLAAAWAVLLPRGRAPRPAS
jgi:putative membrane protein